jgi:hypothetical protein
VRVKARIKKGDGHAFGRAIRVGIQPHGRGQHGKARLFVRVIVMIALRGCFHALSLTESWQTRDNLKLDCRAVLNIITGAREIIPTAKKSSGKPMPHKQSAIAPAIKAGEWQSSRFRVL